VRVFFDTEFQEREDGRVELISLGAIRDDGQEFYSECLEFEWASADPWVMTNVITNLTGPVMSIHNLRPQFRTFCGDSPEFWAYYGAYDWYLICQLYGGFQGLPASWPKHCNELMTLATVNSTHHAFPVQSGIEHHALHDARWNLQLYHYLTTGSYMDD
jgi:hypothetical protein